MVTASLERNDLGHRLETPRARISHPILKNGREDTDPTRRHLVRPQKHSAFRDPPIRYQFTAGAARGHVPSPGGSHVVATFADGDHEPISNPAFSHKRRRWCHCVHPVLRSRVVTCSCGRNPHLLRGVLEGGVALSFDPLPTTFVSIQYIPVFKSQQNVSLIDCLSKQSKNCGWPSIRRCHLPHYRRQLAALIFAGRRRETST